MSPSSTDMPEEPRILTIKVVLKDSEPPIWRRFEIPDHMSLARLHDTLQVCMGWEDDHLHEFRPDRGRRRKLSLEDRLAPEIDEEATTLLDFFQRRRIRCQYIYDFGDDWIHELKVERVRAPEAGVSYPRCTGGERACPPEDCGGLYGYYRILESGQDPEDPEFDEWLPEDFDPDHFDLEAVNDILQGDSRPDTVGAMPPSAHQYTEPVSTLLTLGEPETLTDYEALGIGREHADELIAMVRDEHLNLSVSGSPAVWAPMHAWRALGELRVEEAAEPLANFLIRANELDDDCALDEIPQALGLIGAAAIPPVTELARDRALHLFVHMSAFDAIAHIGTLHPEQRSECVSILSSLLEDYAENDPDVNAFIIGALVDLEAVETKEVMEEAFAADAVELHVNGDWEDVQVELGLLEGRTTARRMPDWLMADFDTPPKPAPPPAPTGKKREKARNKKKAQKKARKKNRRK